MMRINALLDTWPWFSKYQSYGRMLDFFRDEGHDVRVTSVKRHGGTKILGGLYAALQGDLKGRYSVFAAGDALFPSLFRKHFCIDQVYHVMYFECHCPYFRRWHKAPQNVITTIHIPLERLMQKEFEGSLRKISSAIVLDSRLVAVLELYVGKGRVRFIPHGVDTDFFYPSAWHSPSVSAKKRILFAGHHGRDFQGLVNLIMELRRRHDDLCFDLLIPRHQRQGPLRQLQEVNDIFWHEDLSAEALRQLYQECDLLLLPMIDSGANNAVVEALACGLPVVTNNVGGIRDYGGGRVFPVAADEQEMLALTERYLSDQDFRRQIAHDGRAFAVEKLSWAPIARRHIEAYQELCGIQIF